MSVVFIKNLEFIKKEPCVLFNALPIFLFLLGIRIWDRKSPSSFNIIHQRTQFLKSSYAIKYCSWTIDQNNSFCQFLNQFGSKVELLAWKKLSNADTKSNISRLPDIQLYDMTIYIWQFQSYPTVKDSQIWNIGILIF